MDGASGDESEKFVTEKINHVIFLETRIELTIWLSVVIWDYWVELTFKSDIKTFLYDYQLAHLHYLWHFFYSSQKIKHSISVIIQYYNHRNLKKIKNIMLSIF